MTDTELIGRFRNGDKDAFARLVARWQTRTYGLAYRLTMDAEASEDIRQMAFLRAHRALADFDDRSAFSTWLYRIVVNLCRDRHRSREARERVLRKWSATVGETAPSEQTPGRTCERGEASRRVAAAVASLPEEIRQVVIMRHYEGLKFAEIAEILDSPVSTIKSRMDRGLRLLRTSLEDIAP